MHWKSNWTIDQMFDKLSDGKKIKTLDRNKTGVWVKQQELKEHNRSLSKTRRVKGTKQEFE